MSNLLIRVVSSVCAALALLGGSRQAAADLSAQLNAAADTNLYSAVSTRNGGAAQQLLAGRIAAVGACSAPLPTEPNVCSALRRSLLRFDLSAIPAGSQITSATLRLTFLAAPESTARSLRLRRVTASWNEGSGGGASFSGAALGTNVGTGGGATWLHANHNVTDWADGGASVATNSASASVGSPAPGTLINWSGTQLTADVQAWVNGTSSNFGWLLLGEEVTPTSIRRFASREAASVSQRPTLLVTYKLAGGQLCSPEGPNSNCISGVCSSGVCFNGLSQTLSASADANIYSATNTNNGGASQELIAGRIGPASQGCSVPAVCDALRRALVRFNVSTIPAGSQVSNAWLQLSFVLAPDAVARPMRLRRLTASWVEGAGGPGTVMAPALGSAVPTAGGVTWLHANHNATDWTDGGSSVATISATTMVGTFAAGTPFLWTGTQMRADVQSWLLTPANNFGWVLSGDESLSKTIRRFASREATDASRRPKLVVAYKLGAGAICSPNGPNPVCANGTCVSGVCN